MKLTSMEMNNKEFKKNFRGYNCEEVDEFMSKTAEDYESMYKENYTYKEKILLLEDKVNHYDRMENTIQNTLLLAQNAAEQAKFNSQKESQLILKNANGTAQRIIEKAQFDVMRINDDFEKTKQEFNKFRNKFRSFMTSQFDIFDDMEKDFQKNYNIGTKEDKLKGIEKDIDTDSVNDLHPIKTSLLDIDDGNKVEADETIEEAEGIKDINDENINDEIVDNEKNLDDIKNFFVKS